MKFGIWMIWLGIIIPYNSIESHFYLFPFPKWDDGMMGWWSPMTSRWVAESLRWDCWQMWGLSLGGYGAHFWPRGCWSHPFSFWAPSFARVTHMLSKDLLQNLRYMSCSSSSYVLLVCFVNDVNAVFHVHVDHRQWTIHKSMAQPCRTVTTNGDIPQLW
jgi:hypothetical protein